MGKHNMAREKTFENELMHVAALCKCAYIKIPDPIVTNKKTQDRKNYMFTEEKRPFDGILVTPSGNYCIECKYDYNPMLKHQKENLEMVDNINEMAYVLQKLERFDATGYRRISVKYRKKKPNGDVVFETDNPLELVKSFIVKEETHEVAGNL